MPLFFSSLVQGQILQLLNGQCNRVIEYEPRYEKNRIFAYAKTKTQISFAVTAKLISIFVFATRIVQFFYFLNSKFKASSHIQWLHSPFVSDLVGNPEDRFSQNEAHILNKDKVDCSRRTHKL